MSAPTTLPGGGSTLFPPGWTDQLYHEMAAKGRAKLALVAPDWQVPGRRTPVLSEDHKRKMHEGLRRYHERRRAGGQ